MGLETIFWPSPRAAPGEGTGSILKLSRDMSLSQVTLGEPENFYGESKHHLLFPEVLCLGKIRKKI